MIRYSVSRSDLEAWIETESPGWLARAAQRTAEFRRKGRYEEDSAIWSEVKPVYMRLQGAEKCAYCERKLESEEYGRVEQDIEHFRPKSGVRPGPLLATWQGAAFYLRLRRRTGEDIIFCPTIHSTTRPHASRATPYSSETTFQLPAVTCWTRMTRCSFDRNSRISSIP